MIIFLNLNQMNKPDWESNFHYLVWGYTYPVQFRSKVL